MPVDSLDKDGPGFVVHIPFEASDLAAALALAELVVRCVSGVPGVEASASAVSRSDQQGRRYEVLCDRRILGRFRCDLRAGHTGDHIAMAPDERVVAVTSPRQ